MGSAGDAWDGQIRLVGAILIRMRHAETKAKRSVKRHNMGHGLCHDRRNGAAFVSCAAARHLSVLARAGPDVPVEPTARSAGLESTALTLRR